MRKICFLSLLFLASLSLNPISWAKSEPASPIESETKLSLPQNPPDDMLKDVSNRYVDQVSMIFHDPRFLKNIMVGFLPSFPGFSCRDTLYADGSLEQRLSACSILARRIIWENADGERISYSDWPREKKDRLNQIFNLLLNREPNLRLDCPSDSQPRSYAAKFLTHNQAFDIYAAHLAHVFLLEVTHAVPWSFLSFPEAEQEELLASHRYHAHLVTPPTDFAFALPSNIALNRDFQKLPERSVDYSSICDPRIGYRFMRGVTSTAEIDLLGSTPEKTLINLTIWATNNIAHHLNIEARETPMDSRLGGLEKRLRGVDNPEMNRSVPGYYGCWTNANILHDLARSVNIPLFISNYSPIDPLQSMTMHRRHFLEIVHAGLIFQPASHPKILFSADYLTNDTRPSFLPLSPEGDDLTSDEVSERIFNQLWMSPEVLEAKGFSVSSGFPDIVSGVGYGRYNINSAGNSDYYPSYGRYTGFFRGNYEILGDVALSNFENVYRHNLRYNLCAWPNFLETYCRAPDRFDAALNNSFPLTDRDAMALLPTTDDFYNRVNFCIFNFSNQCFGAVRYVNIWSQGFGINVGLGD